MRKRHLQAILLSALALLGGCADATFGNLRLFERQQATAPGREIVSMPADLRELSAAHPFQREIRNAFDLAEQRRFAEARGVLNMLARRLPANSDAWRAVTCTEAIVALHAGELAAFRAATDALDRSLADPLRPTPECSTPLAIARHISGGAPAPIQTPAGLAALLRASPRPTASTTLEKNR